MLELQQTMLRMTEGQNQRVMATLTSKLVDQAQINAKAINYLFILYDTLYFFLGGGG